MSDNPHVSRQIPDIRYSILEAWYMQTGSPHIASPCFISADVLLLQALIADKFDPDKVDSLLRTRKGPPRWLTPLIADRAGRELIYTLSARYKNCQLLKYAMQRILKAGHDDEVGSVGSRLAGYFEVFHNLMVKRLEDMLTADDARMQVLSQELLVRAPPPPPPPPRGQAHTLGQRGPHPGRPAPGAQ